MLSPAMDMMRGELLEEKVNQAQLCGEAKDLHRLSGDGLQGSDLVFWRMLSSLKVVGTNHPHGAGAAGCCDWEGKYGEYQSHAKTCQNITMNTSRTALSYAVDDDYSPSSKTTQPGSDASDSVSPALTPGDSSPELSPEMSEPFRAPRSGDQVLLLIEKQLQSENIIPAPPKWEPKLEMKQKSEPHYARTPPLWHPEDRILDTQSRAACAPPLWCPEVACVPAKCCTAAPPDWSPRPGKPCEVMVSDQMSSLDIGGAHVVLRGDFDQKVSLTDFEKHSITRAPLSECTTEMDKLLSFLDDDDELALQSAKTELGEVNQELNNMLAFLDEELEETRVTMPLVQALETKDSVQMITNHFGSSRVAPPPPQWTPEVVLACEDDCKVAPPQWSPRAPQPEGRCRTPPGLRTGRNEIQPGLRCQSLCGFTPYEPGMMHVHSGDHLEVLEDHGKGWCLCRNLSRNGLHLGWIPTSILPPKPVVAPAMPAVAAINAAIASSSATVVPQAPERAATPPIAPPSTRMPCAPAPSQPVVEVVQEFKAADPSLLSLGPRDLVEIFRRDEKGWVYGRKVGCSVEGWFPAWACAQ